jgi:hypothetical protein
MAIVAVNGGGNTQNGNAADGTSNTLMVAEKFVRGDLVFMANDRRDAAGNADGYASNHLLYQDVVVPLGEVDDEALVPASARAGDSDAYVLTSVAHAATDTSNADTHVDGFRFDLRGHHQASDDGVVLLGGSMPGVHDPQGEDSQGVGEQARAGKWMPTDYCFETPGTTGNAQEVEYIRAVSGADKVTLANSETITPPVVMGVVGDWDGHAYAKVFNGLPSRFSQGPPGFPRSALPQ